MLLPTTTPEAIETIGKLCIGGDCACAEGDFVGLGCIAQQLADYAPEPIHCELAELASVCTVDPARATALWDRMKSRLYRDRA